MSPGMLVLWGLLLLGPWWSLNAQSTDADISMRDRIFMASKVYASVQMYFAHWRAIPNVELDTAYRAYLADVLGSDGRLSFDLATMKFLATFRNGHTTFNDAWLRQGRGKALPFRALFIDGKWVVKSSKWQGLLPGAVIDRLGGTDFEAFFHQELPYISASSERTARSNFCYRPWLFPQRFTLTLAGGDRVEIDREQQATSRSSSSSKDSRPSSAGRWLVESTTAYIQIPSFSAAEYQDTAIEYLKRFRGAETVIVDVRGNSGGSTPSRLIRSLMDRPYTDWFEMTNLHIPLDRVQGQPEKQISWASPWIKPSSPLFGGRLLILVDRDCASACEDFVLPFKHNHRATIIGETTFGSSGQPFFCDLGNGMTFTIGAKREYFPDGTEFEGVGIEPDERIEWNAESLRAGKDPMLEKALEIARQQPWKIQ